MKPTLQKSLLSFFFKEYPNWVSSGAIERLVFKNRNGTTAKPSSVSRALRTLEEKRFIAIKYEGATNTATYKYLPQEYRKNYLPISSRSQFKRNVLWRVPITEMVNHNKPLDKAQEDYWNSIGKK